MRWGIDLGGTKIEGVVTEDAPPYREIQRLRRDTDSHDGYEAILNRISGIISDLAAKVNFRPTLVGIGTPGVIDKKSSLLKNSNTACLNGKPIQQDLEKVLGIPVNIANDANCFALAEACLGAAVGAECVFGVIMGTGIGGGVVLSQKARYGAQGIAGEWGHNILDPEGPLCYCGKRGCIERMISGKNLEGFYKERSGQYRKLSDILELHKGGKDSIASKIIEQLISGYAKSIATVINILDPDVIVLGGGVSNIDLLYTEGFERIKQYVFNDSLDTKIVKNKLGDSAGVFGAAMLTL